MGMLRKRGKIWWIKYYRNGRPYEESARSSKEGDARRLLRLREGDIEKGVPVSPKLGRLRFEEAGQDVINDYTTNGKRSIRVARRRIDKHLKPYFRGRRMASITTSDVRAYVAHRQATPIVIGKGDDRRERQVSNAEINRELTILKRMFSLAMQAGKLMSRPHIALLREDNVRTGFLEREQYEAVLEHLPPALKPVITFAYITGWRIPSEVVKLQWRQVDFNGGTIRLDPGTTKNREGRVFPMTAQLRKLLKKQRTGSRRRPSIVPWVFHRQGEPIVSLLKAWKAACVAAGCPGLIPHDLRRTAVRNLVRAGIPERVAMQMTGHKTRSVFERYNIVSEGDLTAAGRRLDAMATESRKGRQRG
jgi:integrase